MSSDTRVLQAEHLSKRYRVGQRESYRALRDVLAGAVTAPWRVLERRRGGERGSFLWALDEVSFSLERGEVLGLIGPSGGGRSTLVKVLSRIAQPTAGEVRIRGRVGSLLEVGTGFH